MPDLRQSPPPSLFAPDPPDTPLERSDAPRGRETALPSILARPSHPESSHRAAESIRESLPALLELAAKCVAEMPGATRRELARRFCPDDPNRIGRRLDECAERGLIRRGPMRACEVSGREVQTWWPVENDRRGA